METRKLKIDYKYSPSMVELLGKLNATVLLTTYQSGHLIQIGTEQGKLALHAHPFPRPMGMVARGGRIWAGMGHSIHQFANYRGVTEKLGNGREYDACYLPQNIHYTGDIDIHEMDCCGDELYYVNTKFSCLCVHDSKVSFKPVWKPPFIELLQPLDKCHLNGFCSRDGQPRYVTALGNSDEPLGWRANKADGGILMDIQDNSTLAQGLSMPHSPRWYQGRLWLMESGKGSLSYYDFAQQQVIELARLPGFTRGLDFAGELAFVGLSKVRESATFSGLPITRLPQRISGLWVVNIRSGEILGQLEFTAGVDEVFAVSLLPHARMALFDANNEHIRSHYLVANEDLNQVRMPETPLEQATPHFERGNDLYNENHKEQAILAFQEALRIQPDYLPATFNMAVALGDLGRFDEAKTILHQVIEKDAAIVEAYESLGYVYYKQGDLDAAEAQYRTMLKLAPQHPKASSALAFLAKQRPKVSE